MALRNVNEKEETLQQFLQHSSEHCPRLKKLLQSSTCNSHQIDDELIAALYQKSLNSMLDKIKASDFFAIVVDETQDIAGIEQMTFCIRWVDENFIIQGDFVGVHQTDKCDATTKVRIIKNTLLSLGIDIKKCRDQTYDGAAVLQGALNGVGAQIRREVPSVHGVLCLNHNLQLIIQEEAAVNPLISDAITTVQTICNLIRGPPKDWQFLRLYKMRTKHKSLC